MSKKQDEGKSHVYIENPACKPHKAFVIGAINDVVKQQVAEPYCRKRDDERPLFVGKISGPKKNEGSHRSKIRRMRQQSGEGRKQDNGCYDGKCIFIHRIKVDRLPVYRVNIWYDLDISE